MRLVVTRTSRFGFQAEGHEGWFNADRNAAPDLSTIQRGMTLEVEANGRYVRSFSIVSAGENAQPSQSTQADSAPSANGSNRNDTITRLAVIRAVLTATSSFTELTRDRLIQKYVAYAMTGEMPSVPNTDNNSGDALNAVPSPSLPEPAITDYQADAELAPRRRGRPAANGR